MTVKAEGALEWIIALDAFDHDDRKPLANLVIQKPIPDELRPVIAKVISGERKPNRKAAAKLGIPANERMQIAASLADVIDIFDDMKKGDDYIDTSIEGWGEYPPPLESRRKLIDITAEKNGTEPIYLVRRLEGAVRKTKQIAASNLGVSIETVENIVREYREKMRKYPDV